MDSMCTITGPNALQPPGNQKHSPKAITDIALFCSPFFFSCGHKQRWKTSAACGRLDATSLVLRSPWLQGDAASIRLCSTALWGSRLQTPNTSPSPMGFLQEKRDSIHCVALTDMSDRG